MAANKKNTKSKKQPREKNKRVVLWIICAVAVLSLLGIGVYLFGTGRNNQENDNYKIGAAAGVIYRHTYGYKEFCLQAGHELKKYPEYFSAAVRDKIEIIEKKAQANGYTLEDIYQHIKNQEQDTMQKSISDEMENFRKNMIILLASQHFTVEPEKIQWSDKMKEVLGMREACAMFDELSDQFVFSKTKGYKIISKAAE